MKCVLKNHFADMMPGPGRTMFYLGWIFLWLVGREIIKGFNLSDCSIQNTIWTYSSRREEEFVLFCDLQNGHANNLSVQWYLQPRNGEPLREVTKNYPHIIKKDTILHFLTIGANDSGSYICRPVMRSPQDMTYCVNTVLEVKNKTKESCVSTVSHKQELVISKSFPVFCPCLSKQSDAERSEMTWYKNGFRFPDKRENPLSFGRNIFDGDEGMYTCDYTQSDNASSWTVRAVVQVRTIVKDTTQKPNILDPINDTVEVELGKPLTLNCTVQFGFQRSFKPVLKWYIKDSDKESEVTTPPPRCIESTKEFDKIERLLTLKEVTQSDLHKKFICFAQNSIGNVTRSIQLKAKKGVVFIYVLLSTIIGLAGVLMSSAFLYIYWIEIVLLYRTYCNKDETVGDEKEFDAFVSYAKWNSFETQASSLLSEEYLALNLFPEVLENKYGYTLCLLERDIAPGGAYAEDIVKIIKKSRRGIFILSPHYINGSGIFELQAAANLALNDHTLKLILIKFCSFKEPIVLPHLVKTALKVLPTVTWRGLKSVPPNSRFWTQIRYHMPVKHSNGFIWNQLDVIQRVLCWKKHSSTDTTGRSSQPRECGTVLPP